MNTRKKWIIAAIVLLVVGVVICGVAFAASGFEMKKMGTTSYETRTEEIKKPFRNISIKTNVDDVTLAPSTDGKCTVVLLEDEKNRHEVTVEGETLTITSNDNGGWFDFLNFAFESPSVTVYLPANEYAALSIDATTSDVRLPEGITFDSIRAVVSTGNVFCCSSAKDVMELEATTGKIDVADSSAGQMGLSVTTGDVKVSSVACEGLIDANVTTGGMKLEDIVCMDLQSTGSTGDLVMKNVIGTGEFRLERSTGDIRMESCDAASIIAKTSTGDVVGSLKTDKVFLTESGTGDVEVPRTTSGGVCDITTGTGDIQIEIVE